jgi:hypothetical protein
MRSRPRRAPGNGENNHHAILVEGCRQPGDNTSIRYAALPLARRESARNTASSKWIGRLFSIRLQGQMHRRDLVRNALQKLQSLGRVTGVIDVVAARLANEAARSRARAKWRPTKP